MPFSVPSASQLPGVQVLFQSQPRDVFFNESEAATYMSPPPAIDGNASGNGANQPYNWYLWGGQIVGRETASDIWATSIIGLSTVALTTSATTLVTDVGTATELARRTTAQGATTFTLTGPPTAGGTVASSTVTFSAINTSNGHITITTTGVAFVAGSIIGPVDGSQLGGGTIYTIMADPYGCKVVDQLNTTRINCYTNKLWTGGGMINVALIPSYPSDSSLQAYLKAQIRIGVPSAIFSDDWTG